MEAHRARIKWSYFWGEKKNLTGYLCLKDAPIAVVTRYHSGRYVLGLVSTKRDDENGRRTIPVLENFEHLQRQASRTFGVVLDVEPRWDDVPTRD